MLVDAGKICAEVSKAVRSGGPGVFFVLHLLRQCNSESLVHCLCGVFKYILMKEIPYLWLVVEICWISTSSEKKSSSCLFLRNKINYIIVCFSLMMSRPKFFTRNLSHPSPQQISTSRSSHSSNEYSHSVRTSSLNLSTRRRIPVSCSQSVNIDGRD